MSKEEMLHLFDFDEDENVDIFPDLGENNGVKTKSTVTGGQVGDLLKQKLPLPNLISSSDNLIQNLISKHHPRWISNCHEHETLLQDNENDKLSKEEQDLAWEAYQKTLEWEEVRQIFPDESMQEKLRIPVTGTALMQQQRQAIGQSVIDQKPVLSSATRLTNLNKPGSVFDTAMFCESALTFYIC